ARRRPPFWGGVADPDRSLLWLALNTSKRGITLALDRPRGRELFLALAEQADVVLQTEPAGSLAARGLGWETLHARNPRLILCSITPFGQTGPRAAWRGSDLTVVAASGNLYATGDPDRPPVRCSLPVSHYHGGLEAAVGVVFALLAREQTGEGQQVDVALQAAMVMPSIGTAAMFRMTGRRGARVGAFMSAGRTVQREIWPCKDGFVASEQLAARRFFVDVEHPGRGRLRYPGAFAITSDASVAIRRPAPHLGEHTAEVLAELGLDARDVERLRAGAII